MNPPLLDLRSVGHRTAEARWERWRETPPRGTAPLRALTDALVRRALARRVAGRPAPPAAPLLVAVGNLRVGGTGKTPLVLDLGQRLAAVGRRGAVLVRGYGSAEHGPTIVRADDARCGDEARLLAAELPAWTVLQSRNRPAGLAALLGGAYDVILLEDAFQTARLPRHLDVLILDRWREHAGVLVPETGRLLPWGPYREPARGAGRADALVTILDRATPPPPAVSGDGRPVLRCRRRLQLPAGWPGSPGRVGLLSGLARPERFEADAAAELGGAPALTVRCDDHAAYSPALLRRVLAAGERAGVERWLSTGKDRVKLSGVWPEDAPPLAAAGLELDWLGGPTPADLVAARLEDSP